MKVPKGKNMDEKKVASEILQKVGSANNITSSFHCMTRIRFDIKNKEKVDLFGLKEIDEVIEARFQGDQLQVVLGKNVSDVWTEVQNLLFKKQNMAEVEESSKKEKRSLWDRFLGMISGIFSPILPAVIGGGLTKGVISILTVSNLVSLKSDTATVLNIIGNAAFYFMPILVAYSAAKYFKTDIVLSITVVAALLDPTIANGVGKLWLFNSIPIPKQSYGSSLIPAILTVWVLKYVYAFLKKYIPAMVSVLFVPLLTFVIMIPLALAVFGPIGAYAGSIFALITGALKQTVPALYGAVLCGFAPLIIMTGMHIASNPIILAEIKATGKESGFLVLQIFSNMAMAGAVLGTFFKLKNKQNKSAALGSFISAMFGITEPALYGVALKYKKPLYASMISGAIVGAVLETLHISMYGFAAPNLFAMSLLIDPKTHSLGNFYIGIAGIFAAFIIAFIISLILGVNEEVAVQNRKNIGAKLETTSISSKEIDEKVMEEIKAPVNGKIQSISHSKDHIFAEEKLGQGVVIYPDLNANMIYAPFSGKVTVESETKHAIGLTSDQGVELLIHVGIDTVEMKGHGFSYLVNQNQRISEGQPLMSFNQKAIIEAGYDNEIPVVVTNSAQFSSVKVNSIVDDVEVGMPIIYVTQ